jgi:hypothetical protein
MNEDDEFGGVGTTDSDKSSAFSQKVNDIIQAVRTVTKSWPEEDKQNIAVAMVLVDARGDLYTACAPNCNLVQTLTVALAAETALQGVGIHTVVGDQGERPDPEFIPKPDKEKN